MAQSRAMQDRICSRAVRSRRAPPVRLVVSVGLSALVHALALVVIGDHWRQAEEIQAFRARLELPVRFEPRRLGAARPRSLPVREMEYIRAAAAPESLPDPGLDSAPLPALDLAVVAAPPPVVDPGARADTFAHPDDGPMPAPGDYGWADTLGREHFELLRLEDLARAAQHHATAIENPTSRRDLTGFLNLVPLRLYGAGTGNTSLDALARYMRDYTSLLVQVQPRQYEHFESEDLLRAPIHFLVEGGGLPTHSDSEIARLSAAEGLLLGRYLREGGFLFIEGQNRYLRTMVGHLESILGPDGRVFPLPADHPLYSAYYLYENGFPGEDKSQLRGADVAPSWYYPARAPAEQAQSLGPANLEATAADVVRETPLGVWGLEVGGQVVGLLSDLQLHAWWGESFNTDSLEAGAGPMYLQVGANILVYAMLRPGGMTPKRPQSPWAETRPREPVQDLGTMPDHEPSRLKEERDLLGELSGSLAVVRSPLGTELGRGGVRLRVDGQHRVAVMRPTRHGLLLRNLPAGSRWLEIEYGGRRLELAVDLRGGRVTTVSLGVSRLAFLSRLRARPLEELLAPPAWFGRFDDLSIEEIFLDDPPEPESPAPEAPEAAVEP